MRSSSTALLMLLLALAAKAVPAAADGRGPCRHLGKFGPVRYYKLTAQITRSGDALGVKVLSVALGRVDKAQNR